MSRDFGENLRRGLEREDKILDLLSQLRGLVVEPRYAKEGARRGPRHKSAEFGALDLVSHDLLGRFADRDFDIQVKTKKETTHWDMGGYYEHGIDTSVYDNYQATWRATRRPLWLIVWEERPPSKGPGVAPHLLAQWFDRLPKPRQTYGKHAPIGMSHWRRDDFVKLANTTFDPPQWLLNGDRRLAEIELSNRFYNREQKDFRLVAGGGSRPPVCIICGHPIVNPGPDGVPLYGQGWVHAGACMDAAEDAKRRAATGQDETRKPA